MQPQETRSAEVRAVGRRKASDYPQEVLHLFDKYIHGDIDRRSFLEGAQKYAVGGMTAAIMLEGLAPNYAMGQQVAKDDKRIKTEVVTVPSPQGNGNIKGLFAKPANAPAKMGAILVIHENRGLNPHIEDIARRLAVAGFMAYAPDGLTSVGGYPGNEEDAVKQFGTVNRDKMFQDFVASAKWLRGRPDSNGKLGAVGFCFGGGIVNQLAVALGPDLQAGVPFYGGQPPAADVAKIKAPLLINYADFKLDARIGDGWPAYEAALKAAKVNYQEYEYKGANHGFNNDTGARYDKAAADLAWGRTMELFNKYVK
jgi:carboxymethylenebutenolidase